MMPLHDHFHLPDRNLIGWESLHSTWVHCIMQQLNGQVLPPHYRAEPEVHFGFQVQTDIANFEQEEALPASARNGGNGVATAVWAPPQPVLIPNVDFGAVDLFEIRVRDERRGARVVAVIELVSPANKDRPAHREAFVRKCAGFLQQGVSVLLIDVVTERAANLHNDLTQLLHIDERVPQLPEASLYSVAYRTIRANATWNLEAWPELLTVHRALPTMPLWLSADLVVPLHLEASYEETRRVLRLP